MTKVHNLTPNNNLNLIPAKVPIALVKHINQFDGEFRGPDRKTSDWDNVALVSPAAPHEKYDVISCWKDSGPTKASPAVYLGHWNDGVV